MYVCCDAMGGWIADMTLQGLLTAAILYVIGLLLDVRGSDGGVQERHRECGEPRGEQHRERVHDVYPVLRGWTCAYVVRVFVVRAILKGGLLQ